MTIDLLRRKENWAAGDLYEAYVGRWSRLVAREFSQWLAVPAGLDWLDVGCGAGALTQAIVDYARPATVLGIDPSPGFISFAKGRVAGERVNFAVAEAQSLPLSTASVDAAVAGLVLNFVPQPRHAISQMARTTRPGGVVALYVWDYAEKMELMRYFWDAATALDPEAARFDEGHRFTICRPDILEELFTQAGLREVATRAIDVPTVFRNFNDYWSPFLGGQGPAPGYAMSLDETRRAALRDRIRAALPRSNDGAIRLIARAWAVRGRAV